MMDIHVISSVLHQITSVIAELAVQGESSFHISGCKDFRNGALDEEPPISF